ncbi:type IV pilin protein [Candidatus Avelusimicrobium sp.]|uniref:type IV pilin protein n=1 Tax=Candidatus Avelusimicrobium sp. TaxID=3048833 RepID=UPI003D7E29EE
MNKGFTLIELLVVVLIIGILSAVALPQYTKAVEKSRATEAITLLGSLANAEEIYKMSTGSYTGDLSALDIQLPGVTSTATNTINTKNFKITITNPTTVNGTSTTGFSAVAERANNGTVISSGDNQYAIILGIGTTGTITRRCTKTKSTSDVTSMCKSIANGGTDGYIK